MITIPSRESTGLRGKIDRTRQPQNLGLPSLVRKRSNRGEIILGEIVETCTEQNLFPIQMECLRARRSTFASITLYIAVLSQWSSYYCCTASDRVQSNCIP
jgi:hypothetical protein